MEDISRDAEKDNSVFCNCEETLHHDLNILSTYSYYYAWNDSYKSY